MAHVLLVDDEAICREPLAEALRHRGLEVVTASSGAQAIERVRTEGPAVALLDISMPGMDGFALARELRRLPGQEELPIIFLTNHTGDAFLAKAQDLRVGDYLPKAGFALDEVIARVRKHLRDQGVAASVGEPRGPAARDGGRLAVLRVINSSWSSVEDLVAALEREPGVGDRVLSAARSAALARAGAPVTTLEEAVRLLGLTRLRELLQRWDDSRS